MLGKIHNLGERPSLLTAALAEMRDQQLQADRLRFRHNIGRISEIMAYEISRTLPYHTQEVTTPLGVATMQVPAEQPVLVSILRAALPMQEGFLRMMDRADCGFISAYRKHTTGNKFVIKVEYVSSPPLEGRTVLLLDPMIATGSSICLSYDALLPLGTPARVVVAGIIATQHGLDIVQRHLPAADIYVAAIDEELTAKSYIVPGLGDAGDLAFGTKV